MVKFNFWEVYDFYVLDKLQKERPDVPLNDPQITRYHDFVRRYSAIPLEEFLEMTRDFCDGFEERVYEESNLLKEDYFYLLAQLEAIRPSGDFDSEDNWDYQI